FRRDGPESRIALLLVDPTRRRSGGALLGDRIRMNAIHGPQVYTRSLATRRAHSSLSSAVADAVAVLRAASFDLILVETAGIGQGDSAIADLADVSTYVMTPEYGAPSQLEKIDMLELADVVIVNKSDRRGGQDALRDVRKQWRRNHAQFDGADASLPVYATIASQWDDPGLERVYDALRKRALSAGATAFAFNREPAAAPSATALGPETVLGQQNADAQSAPSAHAIVPPERTRYLAEIAETVRDYHARTQELSELAADAEAFAHALIALGEPAPSLMDRRVPGAQRAPAASEPPVGTQSGNQADVPDVLRAHFTEAANRLPLDLRRALADWPDVRARYQADEQSYSVRGREIRVRNHVETLAHTRVPRVAVPSTRSLRELTRYLRAENLPGVFPFSAGVFPFKRREEDPARMFAGEGGPERTNRRFHLLAQGQPAVRLSTAFDSVTLYGRDPHERPDIWGKVGNAGVSVCTLDDAKKLYSGFDLIDAKTSVSMTINGPAPTVLAFFLNAAIDQQVEVHLRARGELEAVRARLGGAALPSYVGALPTTHDGRGLGLLGIPGALAVDAETYGRIAGEVLRRVRGTVQADTLKEDQAQNTCIFSTGFALKLMGDIQSYFIEHGVGNFYSVSVSGYHIAEAGANPVTQLAFTLANAFTYVEYYLSRGMKLDDFAPNLSFFFSSSLDAESSVLGRVARRIWAIALRELYGASERSQKLKYHSQTSGRSLHAQEMSFNDIRTTLQAAAALFDHCNSLHTNAYDEAVTTPTAESVRRALAIQLIIQRELGIAQNENPLQGSYVIEQLTDSVEEAVLCELERLSERGGVLGAMEMLYQRSKIQEESLHYEALKHSGELPLIGVNTFENPDAAAASQRPSEVARSSDGERRAQLDALHAFQARWAEQSGPALARLCAAAARGENVFAELMNAVRYASLGQITDALFAVGGAYRRAM
ncbi:MAG TPA: methylmalonyl-CoA mutase family protein, partial [Polyangiales bacterium]|nr:methylmalonyl-CoA mutase family protein [Polyangiales bacterium]